MKPRIFLLSTNLIARLKHFNINLLYNTNKNKLLLTKNICIIKNLGIYINNKNYICYNCCNLDYILI